MKTDPSYGAAVKSPPPSMVARMDKAREALAEAAVRLEHLTINLCGAQPKAVAETRQSDPTNLFDAVDATAGEVMRLAQQITECCVRIDSRVAG